MLCHLSGHSNKHRPHVVDGGRCQALIEDMTIAGIASGSTHVISGKLIGWNESSIELGRWDIVSILALHYQLSVDCSSEDADSDNFQILFKCTGD